VSYDVLILPDVLDDRGAKRPFSRHIAFDLGEDDRGVEVVRLIAEAHRKRTDDSPGEAPVCSSPASDGATRGDRK
jgi:hypothetical protein